MKIARLLMLVCLFAVLSFAIGATAAQDAPPSAIQMPDQIAGGRPVTITIPDKPPESDTVGLQAWTDQVARFTAKYPNVTVTGLEYSYQPDSFAALVAGKQVATLFRVYLTDPQKYISAGVAADIS